MDLTTIQPIVNVAVPLIVTALIGWLVKHAVSLVPALASFLTAARVTAAENALANAAIGEVNGVLSGTVTAATVKAAVQSKISTLSTQAKTAMSAQGTTEDMMIARAAGNALVKLGTMTPTPAPVAATK